METKTFISPDIMCGHCVSAVQEEVGELAGVQSVVANADTKEVTVVWNTPASWGQISETLEEIGYPAQS